MAEITNITRDFVLGTDGVTYFEVVTTDYDNEEQTVRKKLIGPAAKLAEYYADNFEQIAGTMAANAKAVSRARKTTKEIDNDAGQILAIAGVDPMKTIQDRYIDELTAPGWTIDEGAGFVPIVFSVNGQGNLRYTVNGGSTKGATIYGAVITLKNYPAAPTDVEFYLNDSGKRYYSLPNKNVQIKKP